MRFRKPSLLTRLISAAVAIAAIVIFAVFYNKDKPAMPGQPVSYGSSKLSYEEFYYELNRLISNPDSNTNINGKITFTAYVSDEADEMEFDDDPGVKYLYQTAWISRSDDYFLLDVKGLDAPLEPEQLYTVTGELNGSVYWTEDSKRVTVLDITATDAKPFTRPDVSPNKGPVYTSGQMEYAFRGAHYTTILGGTSNAIVVYFDFKNGSDKDAAPSMYDLAFYQGDSGKRASSTIMSPKEADSRALNASEVIADKTYAGKTGLYFAVYEVSEDVTEDEDVLWLMRYDDDFVLTDDIGIPIMKDYAAWQENS